MYVLEECLFKKNYVIQPDYVLISRSYHLQILQSFFVPLIDVRVVCVHARYYLHTDEVCSRFEHLLTQPDYVFMSRSHHPHSDCCSRHSGRKRKLYRNSENCQTLSRPSRKVHSKFGFKCLCLPTSL